MSERFIEVMKSGFRLLTYQSFSIHFYIKISNMFRALIYYLNWFYIYYDSIWYWLLQSDFGLNGYTRYKVYVWKMLGTFYFRILKSPGYYLSSLVLCQLELPFGRKVK